MWIILSRRLQTEQRQGNKETTNKIQGDHVICKKPEIYIKIISLFALGLH